jgi:mRNA interferase MazF
LALKRGDVVIASPRGEYGKPRPCVVIQSDLFELTDSLLVCLITSEVREGPDLRLTISPAASNGLRVPSQVMIEKVTAVRRERCRRIGTLKSSEIGRLNALLATVIGLNG